MDIVLLSLLEGDETWNTRDPICWLILLGNTKFWILTWWNRYVEGSCNCPLHVLESSHWDRCLQPLLAKPFTVFQTRYVHVLKTIWPFFCSWNYHIHSYPHFPLRYSPTILVQYGMTGKAWLPWHSSWDIPWYAFNSLASKEKNSGFHSGGPGVSEDQYRNMCFFF